jgi:molybdenum cofactor cytidylyltransferase
MDTAIIILAAGNSSRLGRPKQLLRFNGKTLLANVIEQALAVKSGPIVVVLGAYAAEIKLLHHRTKVTFTVNENWQSGMSSSIAAGLNIALAESPELDSAIFTVSDQAYLSKEIFATLIVKYRTDHKNIVTSSYSQTSGTPVLFNKKYFNSLLNLTGSTGAKDLIKKNSDDSASISFDLGHIDIDTETDYHNLINNR